MHCDTYESIGWRLNMQAKLVLTYSITQMFFTF